MIANYHTHTTRCGHAEGKEREYVENALKGGLQILGFSDHSPYWFQDYYSNIRMRTEELPDYAATVNQLRNEYANRIEIHLGVEAEFYPTYFEETVRNLRAHGVEYMILGQHCLGDEKGQWYNGRATTDAGILDRYCGQSMEGMDTGLYSYFAHPDLIHFVGDEKEYERQIRKLCIHARELHLPMEINLLGLREGRHYPNPLFWRIAGEEGITAVLGSDAHQPDAVWVPNTERQARTLAERYGVQIADTITLVHI